MHDTITPQETMLLRAEIEMLMKERMALLRVSGAAASLIAELRSNDLPPSAVEAAELLAGNINTLPEETLQDALNAVSAKIHEG
jgi:hypothetical protein